MIQIKKSPLTSESGLLNKGSVFTEPEQKWSRRMKKQIQEDFFNYMCKVARVERADR